MHVRPTSTCLHLLHQNRSNLHFWRGFGTTSFAARVPSSVRIVEVGPRDGLQNEAKLIVASDSSSSDSNLNLNAASVLHGKVELVRLLQMAGCRHIEVGSFVSPKWVPSMANTSQVLDELQTLFRDENNSYDNNNNNNSHDDGTIFSVLVPNRHGLAKAWPHRAVVDEIAIFASASETFSQRNIACSIDESFQRFQSIMDEVKALEENDEFQNHTSSHYSSHDRPKLLIRGYVSCVMGCPYEGPIDPKAVATVSARLAELGCYEISLGDTIGTGTPRAVQNVLGEVKAALATSTADTATDFVNIAVHFHDTYGQALSNILTALDQDISVVDSSVAGLGGCPYAKGASGNVATEDVIYMLHGLGVETGINLDRLVDAAEYICGLLGQSSRSRAGSAIAANRINASKK